MNTDIVFLNDISNIRRPILVCPSLENIFSLKPSNLDIHTETHVVQQPNTDTEIFDAFN